MSALQEDNATIQVLGGTAYQKVGQLASRCEGMSAYTLIFEQLIGRDDSIRGRIDYIDSIFVLFCQVQLYRA